MDKIAKLKIYCSEIDELLIALAKSGYPVTAEEDWGQDKNNADGYWLTIYEKPRVKTGIDTTTTTIRNDGANKIWDYTTTDIPVDRQQYYVGTDHEMLKGGVSSF